MMSWIVGFSFGARGGSFSFLISISGFLRSTSTVRRGTTGSFSGFSGSFCFQQICAQHEHSTVLSCWLMLCDICTLNRGSVRNNGAQVLDCIIELLIFLIMYTQKM